MPGKEGDVIDGLTDAETGVVNALTAAWNAYIGLPVEHPDDQREFSFAIHAASAKVLMRPARRSLRSDI
jgi:hypothetical protein